MPANAIPCSSATHPPTPHPSGSAAGSVLPPFDEVIAAINNCGARVFAVDIPSGLDCGTGKPLGPTVRARHTATFVARKNGFLEPGAREWLGEVHVVDIGVPRVLVTAEPTN